MNQNVNPWVAAAIILLAISLLVLKYGAHNLSLRVGGPEQMALDARGEAYIHVSDTIFHLTPDGELVAAINLPSLGVFDLVGDFGFFSNGDLLIRQGHHAPSLFSNLWAFLRLPELTPPHTDLESEGMARCDLQRMTCRRFGADGLDFDSAFSIAIDHRTDTVYVADTPRDTLRKFAADGRPLATRKHGFFFPNHLALIDDALLVADTNHHAIQRVTSSNDEFGRIDQTHRTGDIGARDNTWVFVFAQVAANWWVDNLNSSMKGGVVGIFDQQWQFQQRLDLPGDADPLDVMRVGDRVWISDLANNRIYQFDLQGHALPARWPRRLAQQLADNQTKRAHYDRWDKDASVAMILLLVVGFGAGIQQARKAPDSRAASVKTRQVNAKDPNIRWMSRDARYGKRIKGLSIAATTLLLLGNAGLLVRGESVTDLFLPVAMLIAPVLALVIILVRLGRVRVGILGDSLIISGGLGRVVAGRGEEIIYSKTHVLIGSVSVPLTLQGGWFRTDELVRDVAPLLAKATHVSTRRMLGLRLQRQPWLAVGFGLLLTALLGITFLPLFWS